MRKTLLTIALTSVLSYGAQTTFKESHSRYLSGHDIFRVLIQKFPKAVSIMVPAPTPTPEPVMPPPPVIDPNCVMLSDSNRALLGEANPANGETTYKTTSTAFVSWYGKCVMQWIRLETNLRYPKEMDYFFGGEVIPDSKLVEWATLSESVRIKIITHLVAEYIGPGIVANEADYVKKLAQFSAANYGKLSVFLALRKMIFFVVTKDEFLRY